MKASMLSDDGREGPAFRVCSLRSSLYISVDFIKLDPQAHLNVYGLCMFTQCWPRKCHRHGFHGQIAVKYGYDKALSQGRRRLYLSWLGKSMEKIKKDFMEDCGN